MNVLVVDDTKNIRALLTKCLEMEGYTVKAAEDGKTALGMISKERFDLAFIDIKMPVLSGTEVLKQMREMGVETPVIIITAYATVKNAVDCTQLGAVAYLQKPFTADKIKTVLGTLFAGGNDNHDGGNNDEFASVIKQAKVNIAAGEFRHALTALRKETVEHPFEPELFLLLSQACSGLGREDDSKKYLLLYNALI
jgi:DNA-binding NtrC family response regulator